MVSEQVVIRVRTCGRRTLLTVVLWLGLALPTTAQTATPDSAEAAQLVWSTLVALDQANRTGNYTVLRDLAAPDFRDANDAARLAFIFAATRDLPLRRAMLYPVALSEPPQLGETGLLRLHGRLPMRPEPILFDMLFQNLPDGWRILAISLSSGADDPPGALSSDGAGTAEQ